MILIPIEIPKYRLLYYNRNNYSNAKIASIFNCSADLIRKKLKQLGVYKNSKKNNENFDDKKAIVKCLKRKGYSNEFISDFLKDGFKKPYKYKQISTDYIYSDSLNEMSFEEKNVIVGTFLGDGNISKLNVFSFEHSLKQEEYFFFKSNFIKSLNQRIIKSKREYVNPCIETTIGLCCSTNNTNEFIKTLRTESYNPKKIITDSILKYYNELSLAIHFQDDGAKRNSGYIICTECFDKESVLRLVEFYKRKFDLNCSIDSSNRIYIGSADKNKFTELVKPFIHDSMLYKLH